MASTSTSFYAAGTLLVIGGLLLALGLVMHPPPGATPAENAAIIANTPNWAVVHFMIAASFLFLGAAAIIITGQGRAGALNPGLWALAAVSFIAFGAVVIAEVTTIPALIDAVQKGSATETAIFNAFNAFVGGAAMLAVTIFLLSFTVIAFIDHRSKQVVPQPMISVLGSVASFAGFLGAVGPDFGYVVLAPLFFANIFAALYFAYFGWNLRSKK